MIIMRIFLLRRLWKRKKEIRSAYVAYISSGQYGSGLPTRNEKMLKSGLELDG